jgi:predicted phosphate transport protein (TIGR00153 family)
MPSQRGFRITRTTGGPHVRFRLIPRDESFYPLFTEAAENVAECARRLRDLLEDFPDGTEPIDDKVARVTDCERQGDEITRKILRRLHSSFVTPFDREDIHALTEELDDVVDAMQAAADLLVLHNVEKPLPEVKELGDILVEAAETNLSLIRKLSRLRGLEEDLEAIDQLESAADKAYRRSVAHLFSGEYKAFNVLKWKDIVEAIEEAVNAIENVSDIVESIVLKHA